MQTQAHILVNLTLLKSKKFAHKQVFSPAVTKAIITGSIAPDLALFSFTFWYVVVDRTVGHQIWNVLFYMPFWNNIFSFSHSLWFLPLMAILFWRLKLSVPAYFFISASMHALVDFFLHVEDAYRHFWPFWKYKFISPVSYWDPNYYGNYFGILELLVTGISVVWLFKNSEKRWVKVSWVLLYLTLLLPGVIFRLF